MHRRIRVSAILGIFALAIAGCQKPEEQAAQAGAKPSSASAVNVSDQDIANAYNYLLGRVLVLRQQREDFEKDGFEWNKLVFREPGGVAWANPNLDVVYTEAWVAVDENSCVRLDIPSVKGRYYTWHMLNGWGETIRNINERTFPQHPNGGYALCLKDSKAQVPEDLLRVDLPAKTSRVLARVELGDDPKEAMRLQHLFKLTPMGQPKIEPYFKVAPFGNDKLPGAEIFERADAILASEPDINPGMDEVRDRVLDTQELVKSGDEARARVDKVIREISWPLLTMSPTTLRALGRVGNGWWHPTTVGTYGDNYRMRTVTNLAGIWANSSSEATYAVRNDLDGSAHYTMTFPSDALPKSKARAFWSVIAVDTKDFKVIPNPLSRFLLNNQSKLKYNKDGSLTLGFGPTPPNGVAESNWLPTPAGAKYNLTFRFYGPADDVVAGDYFPPELILQQ